MLAFITSELELSTCSFISCFQSRASPPVPWPIGVTRKCSSYPSWSHFWRTTESGFLVSIRKQMSGLNFFAISLRRRTVLRFPNLDSSSSPFLRTRSGWDPKIHPLPRSAWDHVTEWHIFWACRWTSWLILPFRRTHPRFGFRSFSRPPYWGWFASRHPSYFTTSSCS